ncbi:little elongation complex subunit 1 [Bufo bufo]|uniref:little elongation complex subunit 1 n=1 Tax=Bufo bufo TaxID=8384 RepID=UPI001ABDE2FF|nr:little elongation complex subunit 1 [Bufo bufo]
MMPGETHSKTAGIASEAAGSCQNCTSMQQSLNEYVAALIALKQKIIDSDQLLVEYQQKCDDLQYAERENETLRCQLEQMLQKVSPQAQHEEELESLKAELEEKTSTLKIHQQTQMEYFKVKEECEKSVIVKKKLEAKLKKMEEAAAKHDEDYKQLKMEKKVIGKELKKTQKKLDGVQNNRSKKVAMRNAQTQAAREDPVVKLDRQKIKFLLEEIWGCIDSSTENGHCNLLMCDKRQGRNPKNSRCKLSRSHSLEIGQTCNPLAETDIIQLNLSTPVFSPDTESAVVEVNEVDAFSENVLDSKELSDCSSVNSDFESDMNEILEVQDWAKPLPKLLSPIQCSPLTMENLFGEFTDSSDAEYIGEMYQFNGVSQLKEKNVLRSEKNSDLHEEGEHMLVAADNVAVKPTGCPSEGPDLTMDMETSIHDNLETTSHILQEAQVVTEDPIHMEYENKSDQLLNSTACSKEMPTDTFKSPDPKFLNPEFSERPIAEIKDPSLSLDAENYIQDTACHTEKEKMQLANVVNNSTASKMTTSCIPTINSIESNDTVGKIEFDNQMGSDHESFTFPITSKSPSLEPLVVHHNLNPDKAMTISVDGPIITIQDSDEKTVLHMQSENEKSSFLTELHIKQNASDNASLPSKELIEQNCFSTVVVDLSKCSLECVDKTLDTMSSLNLINQCTEQTAQHCIIPVSAQKNDPKSILKPLEQSQPSEPLRQISPLLSSSNYLSVSDCSALGVDHENTKENSVYDKSEDILHEVDAITMDGEAVKAVSLSEHDSTTVNAMESLCTVIDNKEDGLEKYLSKKEKLLKHERRQQNCCDPRMDKIARTSIVHNEDNPHEGSSPDTGDHFSTALGLNVPLGSTVDLNTETELQSSKVDTCNAYSPKLVICDDHLSPPSTVHLNDKCTTCIDTSTDNSSHDLEKPNHQDSNRLSVVISSPLHVEVDSEPNAEENRIKTQCQEVTQSIESSMDLNLSISEKTNTILSPLLKAGLIPAESSKVVPVIPLQHLQLSSESNYSFKKIEKDNTDTCDVSLDSSESEYEFPVRKVNFTRAALNNPVKNESFKTPSDATKVADNTLILLNKTELEEQPKPSTLTHDERGHVATVIESLNGNDSKVENGILIESEYSVLPTVDTEPKNGDISEGNVVECSSDEKSKDISLQEPERQSAVSEHAHIDDDAEKNKNNAETRGQRILPGKNLIWNFSRLDDFVDPRARGLTRKQKTNSDNVFAKLENSVTLQKQAPSNNLKSPSFQTVRKENPPPRLSQGGIVSLTAQVGQTVLANADTSTSTGHSPETINKVRSEMGPPLPPLLGPLLSTPPQSVRTFSPIMSSSSRSSLPSPLDELISPLPGTPFPPLMSPFCDGRKLKSPVFNTPSPAEKANRRILSSPLQFCAATPKHAVPVPGRLPLSANGSSTCNVQENSVKILDTMYPELSARARTLNILKGNVQLNRGMSGDGQNLPVSQITGFKSITSTSTVFIKTGSISKTSNKGQPITCETQLSSESCNSVNKRAIDTFQMPKSAKRLRLDSEPPVVESVKDCFKTPAKSLDTQNVEESCQNFRYCESLPDIVKDSSIDEDIITNALKKVEELSFDLFPVIKSHVHAGTIPNVPVMRDEEKEVIYEFSSSKKGLADRFLHVLLKKINTGKMSLDSVYLQALCRVYVGLCRQLGDIERARILCYSILKEDFPDPDRLLLFIVSSWNDILSLHGVVSKAIQAVLKILAKDDVGSCLSAYLNWEKSPPMNVSVLLNSVLMAIQLYPDVKFHQSEKYGEDLSDNVWEYVFAVDLLCSHRKWVWTHENVISKELWPILDKWVKRKKGNLTVQFIPDIIISTVLRLIGHLCQMGLKEGFITAVKNITSVIVTFVSHANEEGVPWGVQLASVYMLCDTAPCNPALVQQTLQAWKGTTKNIIPPAVINFMQEIASLCVQDNGVI